MQSKNHFSEVGNNGLTEKLGASYYDVYRATGETDPKVEDHLKAIEAAEKKIEELEEAIVEVTKGANRSPSRQKCVTNDHNVIAYSRQKGDIFHIL